MLVTCECKTHRCPRSYEVREIKNAVKFVKNWADICIQKICGLWVGLGYPNPKKFQPKQDSNIPNPTQKSPKPRPKKFLKTQKSHIFVIFGFFWGRKNFQSFGSCLGWDFVGLRYLNPKPISNLCQRGLLHLLLLFNNIYVLSIFTEFHMQHDKKSSIVLHYFNFLENWSS